MKKIISSFLIVIILITLCITGVSAAEIGAIPLGVCAVVSDIEGNQTIQDSEAITDNENIPLLSDGGENYVSPLRHLFMYAKGQQDINARTLFESVLDLAFGDTSRAVRNIPM